MARTFSRRSLADKCYQTIKGDILSRKIGWGQRLDVDALCRDFGVSRSPVVQAIARLAGDGLVVIRPHKGSFVVRPSLRDVIEVTQVRVALETYALELAVPLLSPSSLEHIDSVLTTAEESNLDTNPEVFLQSDRVFHETLVNTTGNSRLAAMFNMIRSQVELFRLGSFSGQAARDSMRMHRLIFEAIKRNDLDSAKALLREHIEEVGRQTQIMLGSEEPAESGQTQSFEDPSTQRYHANLRRAST